MMRLAGRVVFACLVTLIAGCGQTYPNGPIKDRNSAIGVWRHLCAGDVVIPKNENIVVELLGDEWTVGFHDESAVVIGVFDAKSGKMKRCNRGARN